MRLFVVAGEPSGDRIGADLVERLRARTDVELSGVGGPELAAAGLRSMFPMDELAVMGWADVLPRLPWLLWRSRQVARAIIRTRPDAAVLIDAQEFSRIVARQVRASGAAVPLLLYVAPAAWAWKPERATTLAPLFDEVLAVLPFEPKFMAEHAGPPTSYVGHPALSRFEAREKGVSHGPVLLLPGSREGELRRHLPLMREIAIRFANHPAVEGFVLPTPGTMRDRVAAEVGAWPVPPRVAANEDEKRAVFREAVAAVAVTGTVTLELALAGVPMVTTYVADRGQAKRWVKYGIRFAALPNILLGRPLVPEVLGLGPDVEGVAAALEALLAGDAAARQLAGFAEIRALMQNGAPQAPRLDPAERVIARSGQRAVIGT